MFDLQLSVASRFYDYGRARRRVARWVAGLSFAFSVIGLVPTESYAQQRETDRARDQHEEREVDRAREEYGQREQDQAGDEKEQRDQDEQDDHDGFFSRAFLGIGYGSYIGAGRFNKTPGVRLIEDPTLGSPALNIALDGGIGIIDNLAIHVSLAFETLLVSKEGSDIDGFYLFGLGGGATYYFMPFNFYLSGHIRWAGALFYLPNAPCDIWYLEKFKGFGGIGLSLAFGKEWFTADNDAGIGIGLQGNWVYLGDSPNFNYLSILLIPTLVSF